MANQGLIFKLFVKEAILQSVPGLKDQFRTRSNVEELSHDHEFQAVGTEQMPLVASDHDFYEIPEEINQHIQAQGQSQNFQSPGGIDFGNLLPLIQDPGVNMIECPGPDKNIVIRTHNIRRPTNIKLNQGQMEDVIKQFSRKARVPLINGLFRSWVDKFMVSSIISHDQVSNFIIQKVIYPHFG